MICLQGWSPEVGRRALPFRGGGRLVRLVPDQRELELLQEEARDETSPPIGADVVEALGPHMWPKATDALVRRQTHGLPAMIVGILIAEVDVTVLNHEAPAIG